MNELDASYWAVPATPVAAQMDSTSQNPVAPSLFLSWRTGDESLSELSCSVRKKMEADSLAWTMEVQCIQSALQNDVFLRCAVT